MRRRAFIAGTGSAALLWPLATRAEAVNRVVRVAMLETVAKADDAINHYTAAFRKGLEERGWTSATLRFDVRWAAMDPTRYLPLAREIVALAPDVVVAVSPLAVNALREAKYGGPIVFVIVPDPVASGFVAKLSHPGGATTGFTAQDPAVGAKWVSLLKQAAPGIGHALCVWDAELTAVSLPVVMPPIEGAAQSLGLALVKAPIASIAELQGAVESFARAGGGGMIVLSGPFMNAHIRETVALAAQHRLPSIFPWHEAAEAGALLSYGIDFADVFHSAADYVDRILHGAKPADLPVQAPTKYQLVINLKTAKALGLAIPAGLVASADQVIE